MPYGFIQKTGEILWDHLHFADGYSGHGLGKNNPDMEMIGASAEAVLKGADYGPLPHGWWKMVEFIEEHPHLGKSVIRLEPLPGTNTYGRGGFYWHGDSWTHPGEASLGCIISGLIARLQAWKSGDHLLKVIPYLGYPDLDGEISV